LTGTTASGGAGSSVVAATEAKFRTRGLSKRKRGLKLKLANGLEMIEMRMVATREEKWSLARKIPSPAEMLSMRRLQDGTQLPAPMCSRMTSHPLLKKRPI
jgi:hypothetical protein